MQIAKAEEETGEGGGTQEVCVGGWGEGGTGRSPIDLPTFSKAGCPTTYKMLIAKMER